MVLLYHLPKKHICSCCVVYITGRLITVARARLCVVILWRSWIDNRRANIVGNYTVVFPLKTWAITSPNGDSCTAPTLDIVVRICQNIRQLPFWFFLKRFSYASRICISVNWHYCKDVSTFTSVLENRICRKRYCFLRLELNVNQE